MKSQTQIFKLVSMKKSVIMLSRARGAQLKGRSYAEVLHRELCVLSSLYLGYRPGIGCRE
jgi:hypothetical protein